MLHPRNSVMFPGKRFCPLDAIFSLFVIWIVVDKSSCAQLIDRVPSRGRRSHLRPPKRAVDFDPPPTKCSVTLFAIDTNAVYPRLESAAWANIIR